MVNEHRILIVEDHTILREGLKAIIENIPNYIVVGEAGDGLEAVQLASTLEPDLILMDLSLPKMSGISAIKEIKKRYCSIKVVALTVHDEDEYIQCVFQAGAEGYVLKDASKQELLLALNNVLIGKRYVSSSISHKLISGYLEGRKVQKASSGLDLLSEREIVILKLISEGNRNKDISQYLNISEKTVKKHRANIMSKLNLHSASALTSFALKSDLIK
jgi:DNA-binding NarL/FixJ family response regulator